MQSKYWNQLYQLRTHLYFVEILLKKYERNERGLKIIVAISSSASIASWALWQELPFLWASIIVLGQVITAVNPYLPYFKNIEPFSALMKDMGRLMLDAEEKWFPISEGEFSEREINTFLYDIKKQKGVILNKHIKTAIPTDEKIRALSEECAQEYFKINFGV